MKSLSSLSFLNIGSLVFPDIVYDVSWRWYPVTNGARSLKKKFGGPNLGPMDLNQADNKFFCNFLKFKLYVFLEIA